MQNTKIKRLEDIRNEPLICLGKKSTTYSFYSKFFLEHDVVLEPDIEVETMGSDSSVDLEWTWDWIPSGFICERSFEIESDPGDPDGRKNTCPGDLSCGKP